MSKKMQYCFNCGVELGVYDRYPHDPPECCGERDCQRELTTAIREEQAEREERAREDNYERY